MDRRTFMTTAVCVPGAAACAWPWLEGFSLSRPAVAVIDSTLAKGAAFAGYAAQWRWTVLEAGDDIGALWYMALAPLLRATPGAATMPAALIGLTRASDYFVLEQLATGAGHRVEHCLVQSAASGSQLAHVAFAFGPRALG
ncbi:hypothetical protein A6V36_06750 [Paraburkholderia ginsengiterrae]|uniref:Uncharacterized protein n=1 Tax=Paraburkholderia ginsengiterrae TaxID=1462993 RepID=A0A1A9MZI4_9BURK|nr:hypothetical protein [Paraburkholderia ginsengiterrae]OAJ54408.1 hypothetical protein A6V37_07125 [Paraburkholderia ginsengiterrae]OAJ56217.1 hypothetical protein A6V36_06750 [Paraburkholderia ginsengiterrae]